MTIALIFLPIFIGLSAVLTVVVADLLSPQRKDSARYNEKLSAKRPATA